MYKRICHRVIATIIIVIAFALAITISIWHHHHTNLARILFVSRFFDIMLPVLAVGALIKYLIFGNRHKD